MKPGARPGVFLRRREATSLLIEIRRALRMTGAVRALLQSPDRAELQVQVVPFETENPLELLHLLLEFHQR